MAGSSIIRLAGRHAVACGFFAAGLCLQPCFAQFNTAITQLDPYGNARPGAASFRQLARTVFPNDAQRETWQRRFYSARRLDRRGGQSGFALPTDLSVLRGLPVRRPSGPEGGISPSTRRAFARYGGFGKRSGRHEPADLGTLFERRYALLEATSRNAPVTRARWQAGLRGFVLPTGEGVAMRPSLSLEPDASGVALDQYVHQDVALSLDRVRGEAWRWFRQGAYRRAAKHFELAVAVEPNDVESRFGELFSYIAISAVRTSFATLEALTLRDPNPFAHALNLSDRFAGPAETRKVRLRSQQIAQAGGDHPQAVALHVLVLWYLGARQEAILTANAAADVLARSSFADFPAKMRAAQARIDKEP